MGNVASDSKKLHQIVELSVDISADIDGRSNRYNIGLFCKYFFGFVTQDFDFLLIEQFAL